MRWVLLAIVYVGCIWETLAFLGYLPTITSMIHARRGPFMVIAVSAMCQWIWFHLVIEGAS